MALVAVVAAVMTGISGTKVAAVALVVALELAGRVL
jgi:hypothetical protein